MAENRWLATGNFFTSYRAEQRIFLTHFDRVLFVDGKAGTPYVEGAKVTGLVQGPASGEKIYVQKFKRRKNYRRRTGHRQSYTKVEIKSIDA